MVRSRKVAKLMTHLVVLISLSFIISLKSPKSYSITKIVRFQPDLKHILVWTSFHGYNNEGQNLFIKKRCPKQNCYITKNRSLFGDTRYFDAVLFNAQDVHKEYSEVPRYRSVMQKYIFVANDSSDNYPVCDPIYDTFFNWTWTYKSDSTIPYKFISVRNHKDEDLGSHFRWKQNTSQVDKQFINQLYSKSKAAVAFINKCDTTSKRENFIRGLQRRLSKYHLSVDVFGDCGPKNCKRKTMAPCYWKLRKNYYFFLALEDSIADDYITDIVVNAYKHNAVPIVLGGANYNDYLPPGSYLDALKLGEEQLAKAMHDIIRNRSRYINFFNWRKHYTIIDTPILNPCTLCTTLNNPDWLIHKVSYINFREWWNPNFQDRCSSFWNLYML